MFFVEKMREAFALHKLEAFALQKLITFFQQKILANFEIFTFEILTSR